MSQHHRAQKWTSKVTKLRAHHAATLPAPCIQCGRAIHPTDTRASWQVGHRVDAALGGQPTIANTGPIHTGCNRAAGGRLGARITNGARQAAKDIRAW